MTRTRVIPCPATRSPAQPDHVPRLAFRPDIEGLRAIAILLVVAAHAKLPGLAGGFIGVDIFFVLSGFLITGLLLREAEATGTIDLTQFYARRLRRLLPALAVVILATIAAAALLLAPMEQVGQIRSAAAAALWASNLVFAFANLDYFGPTAETNLFTHTWSLGVEEQFYLIWPLLFMFLLGAWQRRRGGPLKRGRLAAGLIAIVVVAAALCVFLTSVKPTWGFYLMPARAWQFGIGALLALSLLPADADKPTADLAPGRRWLLVVGGYAGIALIATAALLLDPTVPYPGVASWLPTAGAALVILSGAAASPWSVSRVLALPPLQTLGRLSYSWYLWHWPVLLLGATVTVGDAPPHPLLLAGIALALAYATYHLVEAPIRFTTGPLRLSRYLYPAAATAMAALVAVSFGWRTAAKAWAQMPEQRPFEAARRDLPEIYPLGCDGWFHSAEVKPCLFGSERAEKTAVLIGDSIGVQWFPAVASLVSDPGWRLVVLTKSACPMVEQPFFLERIRKPYTVCDSWRTATLDEVARLKADVVFMGSAKSYPFDGRQWTEGSVRVLERIAPHAKRVYLIQATGTLDTDGPICLARHAWRSPMLPQPPPCAKNGSDERAQQVNQWLRQAASRFANVAVLDLNAAICRDGVCRARVDDIVVYRDAAHLSSRFVWTLRDVFADAVRAAGGWVE